MENDFSHGQNFSTTKKLFSILFQSKYVLFILGQNFLSGTKNVLSRTILILSGTKIILSGQKDEALVETFFIAE